MMTITSFAPIVDARTKILILGSIPGIKSLEKVEYYGNKQNQLKDICAIVGATYLSEDAGHDITSINPSVLEEILGSCESITVTADSTTFVNGHGTEDEIATRIAEIKSQLEFKENESEKLLLKERLAKLEGGVAILKIGAYSDVELKEKKDRLDDALSATRSAIEEGILPGGGIALLSASIAFSAELANGTITFANEDQLQGAKILIAACEAPLSAILANAGINFEVVKKEIITVNQKDYGYNARTEEYTNMITAGIIDPAKVTRSALENAVSISGLMLTTECTLIEEAAQNPAEA